MQRQCKAKGTQDKDAERVEWFMQTASCTIYLKRHKTEINVKKCEVTKLSNVNVHVVRVNSARCKLQQD